MQPLPNDLPSKRFSRRDGLPGTQVHALTCDHQGRYWFAGSSGLASYDGVSVRRYQQRDGLSTHGLRALAARADAPHELLVGGDAGVDLLDVREIGPPRAQPLLTTPTWTGGRVETLLPDPDAGGGLWIGTASGLYRWEPGGTVQAVTDPALARQQITALVRSGPLIWAATQSGALRGHPAPGTDTGGGWRDPPVALPREAITALSVAPDGTLFIGGHTHLTELSPDGTVRARLPLPAPATALLFQPPTGTHPAELWVAAAAQLLTFRRGAAGWQAHGPPLAEGRVNALHGDSFGNVWAATDSRGVLRVSALRRVYLRPRMPLPQAAYSVRPSGAHAWLIGTEQALWRLEENSAPHAGWQGGVVAELPAVWDTLELASGERWFATQQGVWRAAPGQSPQPVAPADPEATAPARALLHLHGTLWIGTVRGLLSVPLDGPPGSPVTLRRHLSGGTPLGYVYTLCAGHDGTLWIGTLGQGLWHAPDGQLRRLSLPVPDLLSDTGNVYALAPCDNGDLIAVQDNRVLRLGRGGGRVLARSEEAVAGWTVLVQGDRLWVGGSDGLTEYDAHSGERRRQSNWPGADSWEFTTSRSLAARPGALLCGLNTGLLLIDLTELGNLTVPPQPTLAALTFRPGPAPLPPEVARASGAGPHTLPQGHWGLEVWPACPWYLDEDTLQLRHRLLGWEAEWSAPHPPGPIQYQSLPAGRYTLQVQAFAPLTGWGDPQALLRLHVQPPRWQRRVRSLLETLTGPLLQTRRLRRQNLALEQRVLERTREVERAHDALLSANRELQTLSLTDALTGVANRRHFDGAWQQAAAQVPLGHAVTLALLDIDHFKGFNDTYGHQEGDRCLQRVAGALRGALRGPGDLLARYGGEEFAVILPGESPQDAAGVIERLRRNVEALGIPNAASPFGTVTVSVGAVSVTSGAAGQPGDWIALADQSLYRAKHAGRNRSVHDLH
ncbi:diguanylate cyclase [Deinococcus depolymerans]|uniref:GGDEF domain-containing protein n=1 Tax=Deinococcus depolymerans TaxID=392408 RepID=A0ABP3M921_9DEIO